MAKIKNISSGPRGLYIDGQMVMLEPGESRDAGDATDYPAEWFEGAGAAVAGEDDDEADESELGKMTVAELKAVAEAESIDLGDATKKADIRAAIELAREG